MIFLSVISRKSDFLKSKSASGVHTIKPKNPAPKAYPKITELWNFHQRESLTEIKIDKRINDLEINFKPIEPL